MSYGSIPLMSSGRGNIYAGLTYPIVVALMTFVVGALLIKETNHIKIWDEVGLRDGAPFFLG